MISIHRFAGHAALLVVFIFLTFFAGRPGTATSAMSEEPGVDSNKIHLPVVLNRFDNSLGIPLFGLQTYSTKFTDDLSDSGARWVRAHVGWGTIESTPGVYNWSSADKLLGPLSELPNMNVIVTIDDTPAWASLYGSSGRRGPIRADKLPNYAAFVSALVERFDGDSYNDAPGSPTIRYWEFYNEPDANSSPGDVRWGNYGDQYAQMLQAVYPAIKAASPQAQVVFGGIAYDWFQPDGPFIYQFFDDVLAAGAGPYFDVMNFHAYPSFATNWATHGPGVLEKTEYLRAKLANYELEKPMIITEAGWHSNATVQFPWTTPETQARYVVQLFTQAKAADLQMMIWWMLHDPGGYYPYENGLLTIDGVRKPAFYAYQTVVSQLSTAHFVRRLSAEETGAAEMEAYEFNDKTHNRTLYVVWMNPMDTTAVQPFYLPAGAVTIRNIYGEATVLPAGPDGLVTINIGTQPVYIEVAR
jgi:hypothetical protein